MSEFDDLIATTLKEKTEAICRRSERLRQLMAEITRYVMGGGKRLRPQLMCWGYQGAGGTDDLAIKQASVSIELIHSYLLIHDDIIDRDETRRGQPTVHVAMRTTMGKSDEHLGMSLATMAGDLLCSFGYEIISESGFAPVRRLAALNHLNIMLQEVIAGEWLDILSPYLGAKITEADIMDIARYKTAAYSVEGPLHLGGLLAGASAELLATYTAYAIPIGIAFQLRDDVLGVFGDPKITGKSASSDLQEGKRTFLMHTALEMATPDDRDYLQTWLGNPKLGVLETKNIRAIIERSGALAAVEARIAKLQKEALDALKGSALENLKALTITLVNREK